MNETQDLTPTTAADNRAAQLPYDFSYPTMRVPINTAQPGKTPVYATHVVRVPDLEQLIEREKQSKYETVELSRTEDIIQADDDLANKNLFAAIADTFDGYVFEKFNGDKSDRKAMLAFKRERARETRQASEFLDDIPMGHKRAVLQAVHAVNAEVEVDEEFDFVDLSSDDPNMRITCEIGSKSRPDYTLTFIMRKPEEDEISRYKRVVAEVRSVKGSRKARQRIVTNTRAGIEAFDLLFVSVEGGAIGERASESCSKAELIKAIKPIIKGAVARAAMSHASADSSD